MEQEIMLLQSSKWEMTGADGAVTRRGTTIWYVNSMDKRVNPDGTCGEQPCKSSLAYEVNDQIAAHGGCPCRVKARFVIKASGNKKKLEVDSIEFIEDVKK